jgi:protein ImuA
MSPAKHDMITRLRTDILIRQGLQKLPGSAFVDMGLGVLNNAFPGHSFPLAAVHEFVCTTAETRTASAGFIAALLSRLMERAGPCIWIAPGRNCYPPALTGFGIDPSRIVFIDLARDKELLWTMEEALKCDGLCAVVGEIRNIDFTISRRLQLAVEKSRVTGFLLRQTQQLNTTACVSRWRISAAASDTRAGMPGVGFPRWNVELLKIRNGQPGHWQLEWIKKKFREVNQQNLMIQEPERKIV